MTFYFSFSSTTLEVMPSIVNCLDQIVCENDDYGALGKIGVSTEKPPKQDSEFLDNPEVPPLI